MKRLANGLPIPSSEARRLTAPPGCWLDCWIPNGSETGSYYKSNQLVSYAMDWETLRMVEILRSVEEEAFPTATRHWPCSKSKSGFPSWTRTFATLVGEAQAVDRVLDRDEVLLLVSSCPREKVEPATIAAAASEKTLAPPSLVFEEPNATAMEPLLFRQGSVLVVGFAVGCRIFQQAVRKSAPEEYKWILACWSRVSIQST